MSSSWYSLLQTSSYPACPRLCSQANLVRSIYTRSGLSSWCSASKFSNFSAYFHVHFPHHVSIFKSSYLQCYVASATSTGLDRTNLQSVESFLYRRLPQDLRIFQFYIPRIAAWCEGGLRIEIYLFKHIFFRIENQPSCLVPNSAATAGPSPAAALKLIPILLPHPHVPPSPQNTPPPPATHPSTVSPPSHHPPSPPNSSQP